MWDDGLFSSYCSPGAFCSPRFTSTYLHFWTFGLKLLDPHIYVFQMSYSTEDQAASLSMKSCHSASLLTRLSIFAIHGLGSDPNSAWTYRDNGTEVSWLRDILPNQKELEYSRIAMVNHETRWHSSAVGADFDYHAEMVLNEIEALHHVRRYLAHTTLVLTSVLGFS